MVEKRLIDAKALIQDAEPYLTWDMLAAINNADTVDAVEVVRCRDCIYWQSGDNEAKKWEYCVFHDQNIGPHAFCSFGERKEGAD